MIQCSGKVGQIPTNQRLEAGSVEGTRVHLSAAHKQTPRAGAQCHTLNCLNNNSNNNDNNDNNNNKYAQLFPSLQISTHHFSFFLATLKHTPSSSLSHPPTPPPPPYTWGTHTHTHEVNGMCSSITMKWTQCSERSDTRPEDKNRLLESV